MGYKHNFGKCQECGGDYIYYDHKFRPPKRSDLKAWQVVKFLKQNGFTYQRVYDEYIKTRQYGYYTHAVYPKSMSEAKEFVARFGNTQAQ